MKKDNKIISFNDVIMKREQEDYIASIEKNSERKLDNWLYRGSITINISGSSPQDAQYEIYTEFFTEEEMLQYLSDAYFSLISKKEVKETVLNYDLILNTCTTIYFYYPFNKNKNKMFCFEYSKETSDEQIEQIMAATILVSTD